MIGGIRLVGEEEMRGVIARVQDGLWMCLECKVPAIAHGAAVTDGNMELRVGTFGDVLLWLLKRARVHHDD